MICDRCHRPLRSSANPDQPMCAPCLEHCRAGGAWPLGSPAPEAARRPAPLDLDLLPFQAQVLYGEVPLYPIREDLDRARFHVGDGPAAEWNMEAVRWRYMAGHGKPLEEGLPFIAGVVAARLWRRNERRQAERCASC